MQCADQRRRGAGYRDGSALGVDGAPGVGELVELRLQVFGQGPLLCRGEHIGELLRPALDGLEAGGFLAALKQRLEAIG